MQMQNAEGLSLDQIRDFLQSSEKIEFSGNGRTEVYAWTERVLVAQQFACQNKKQRGYSSVRKISRKAALPRPV